MFQRLRFKETGSFMKTTSSKILNDLKGKKNYVWFVAYAKLFLSYGSKI